MNWPHAAHNNTREIPRYIFTIFTIILYFFNFKSSITPLILIFITYYYFEEKKKRPYFLKKTSHIYIYFFFYNFWDFAFFFL